MKLKAGIRIGVIWMCGAVLTVSIAAQKTAWRQASPVELAAILPSRAPVENEHIETELRTASGIVDDHGHMIAGVVLLTAGYSADGKYSHYMVVQTPLRVGSLMLRPGQYAVGWARGESRDRLIVHFNVASTGRLIGTTEARRITDSTRLESLHIWPPEDKSIIQIGRFMMAYRLFSE